MKNGWLALLISSWTSGYVSPSSQTTVFDGSVHYDLGRLNGSLKGASVAVTATNLLNKDYLSTCDAYYCYYGDERSVVASATYKF